jgi:integrase
MRVVNHYLSKRGKTFYFVRRVPDDVSHLHSSGSIRETLNTSDIVTARKMRDNRLKQLEASWNAYRALPKGKHINRQLLSEALALREQVQQGEDREEILEHIEDRTNDLYNSDIPEQDDGRRPSKKAGEFFDIASGKKTPTRIAVEAFLARVNLKPTTRGLYKGLLKQLGDEFTNLEDINRQSVRTFLQSFSKTRTIKTVRNLITASRQLLSFHGHDPIVFDGHRIDAGKPNIEKGIWTDNEVLRLASANAAPQWLKDCITVALYSGLRRQEIGGLVYDADKDQLVVGANKAKTASSVRRVPCHSKAREAAKRIAAMEPEIRLNKITTGMHELADKLDVPRTVVIDGVPHKRDFHALRHTFASKLTSMGIELSTISRILGHAPTNVTGRYAGKVDPEIDRKAIERVTYED